MVTASIAIEARPEDIVAILLDLTNYPSWQNGIESIVVEDTDERGRPHRTRWHVNAMGLRATHSVCFEYADDYSYEYHLVDSEVMTQYDFSCRVAPDGAGSSAVTVSQDLGIKWAMPKAILEKNAEKGLNKMLAALKQKAENLDAGEHL